ncbi:MAG TPA: hypothetical protein VJ323_09515 [Bryobacteraceae bacterium]|nr:hypothetical protein [Bryobacteraceae bacterium]
MSYLDNLENTLKNLESRNERDPLTNERREADRAGALAAAPWADRLKSGAFTTNLMDAAAVIGHKLRAKVYMAWLGNTLRFELRQSKLELRPTAEGVLAVFMEGNIEIKSRKVDLESNPDALIEEWIGQSAS